MLSINAIKSARQARHYYAQADYYAKGDEADISSGWFGQGAENLGLSGSVDTGQFKALLDGRLPDGTELGRIVAGLREHRAGWDFTLSAPKSVSILALAGGDHRLIAAHHEAVQVALSALERDYALARKQLDGETVEEATGNLTIAQFTHTTSRAVDPQLHTHNVVMNATQREDGTWRALETRRMYDGSMTVGQIYRAELAVRVRALGYEIETNARKGTFDISAVPAEVRRGFSKRREEIEQAVERFGYRTAKGLDKAAVRTRAGKVALSREELLRGWANEMAARGFDPEAIITEAKARAASPREVKALRDDLTFAYRNLAEREAVFPRDQVVRDTLRVGLGKYGVDEVANELERVLDEGDLVTAELRDGRRRVPALTTPKAIRKEAYILSLMEAGRDEVNKIAPARVVNGAIASRTLGKEQAAAVRHMLSARDRIIGVQGFAGTGKTYALDTVREVAEKRRFKVIGLAPTAAAARELEAGSGIQSQTLASFLAGLKRTKKPKVTPKAVWVVDEASLTNANDMADILTWSRRTRSRVIVIGDRLQLSAIEYGKPFEQMQRAGLAVAEIRDIRRQKDPNLRAAVVASIDGDIPNALARIANRVFEIDNRDERVAAIARDFLSLSPEERAKSLVLIPDNETRALVNQQIRQGLKRAGSVGEDRLTVSALSNRGLSRQEKGRAELYEPGDIVIFGRDIRSIGVEKDVEYAVMATGGKTVVLRGGDGHEIAWKPSEVAGRAKRGVEVYSEEQRGLAVGDLIRWRRNDTELGRRNGDVGQVATVTVSREGGTQATIRFGDGVQTIDLHRKKNWEYAYATTIHGAQGATAERTFVHAESFRRNLITRKSFYVALSRSKSDTIIYTDDAWRLAQAARKRLGEKTSALETKGWSHHKLCDRAGLVERVLPSHNDRARQAAKEIGR